MTMCGTETHDMSLNASTQLQSFYFDGLRALYQPWKEQSKRYDVCYYTVFDATGSTWEEAKLYLRFSLIKDVQIWINGGTSLTNASEVLTGPVPN